MNMNCLGQVQGRIQGLERGRGYVEQFYTQICIIINNISMLLSKWSALIKSCRDQ